MSVVFFVHKIKKGGQCPPGDHPAQDFANYAG